MQDQDETNEAPTPAANTKRTKSRKWERRIAIVGITAASIGLITYTILLIYAYVAYKPSFELLRYSAEVIYIAGYLAVFISILASTERKKLSYISAFMGTVLMFLSFGLFIGYKPRLEWWRYFHKVALGTALTTLIFSRLVGTERQRLYSILQFISASLFFAAFVLMFLGDA